MGSWPQPPQLDARPTLVRWKIVSLLVVYVALCHFNRSSMPVAGTERIMTQYGISPTSMGSVYTAYLIVYTICMPIGGWLIDRKGTRWALVLMGFGTSVFVALTGGVGFLALSGTAIVFVFWAVRGTLGALTSPIHPCAARAVALWFPPSGRSVANGIVTSAALVAIAFTPLGFGRLMDLTGWPVAFMLAGGATALAAVVWTATATDGPKSHPRVNEAELRLIHPDRTDAAAPRGGVLELLKNRSLILLTLSYAADNYFQYLLTYWLQYYFINTLHRNVDESRLYTMLPLLTMAAGMFAGGWICDRMELRLGRRRGRGILSLAGLTAAAVFLGLGVVAHQFGWVLTWFMAATAALGLCEAAFWTTATEVGGPRGGTAAAILNTGGNGGGLLAPWVSPLVAKAFGWSTAFGLACAVCFAGALLWLRIDPDERIEPAPAADPPPSAS